MAQGLLTVDGSIDLSQFWPQGEADADTTKILVRVSPGAFQFRPHATAPFQNTHAFDHAIVRGKVRKPCIDTGGRVTVRLQGIDAPELHYMPQAAKKKADQTKKQRERFLELNEKYRQKLAETATVNLSNFLLQAGLDPLPCTVVTAVDQPNDVFDTYARFVGSILVRIQGQEKNINKWLVEQGWAFPAFYTSMSDSEIQELMTASTGAKSKPNRVWKKLHRFVRMTDFDWDLIYRGKGATVDAQSDIGPVVVPKLFRRLSVWAVNRKAGMVKGSFAKYLKTAKDEFHRTDEFLDQGASAAETHTLDEFVGPNGKFSLGPEEMVFREKPSKILGPHGAPVNW
ncbi:MAG: thermonuclease family protein [Terriglobia bacterium]